MESLLGMTESQVRSWPGILAYCRCLEVSLQPLSTNDYASVWSAIGVTAPKDADDLWMFAILAVRTLRRLDDRRTDSSIDEVWDEIVPLHPGREGSTDDSREITDACFIALFAILCLSTMTLPPYLMAASDETFPSLQLQRGCGGLKIDFAQRPIPKVFENLQKTMKKSRWRHPICGSNVGRSTPLHVPSLNFAALAEICKIRIVWVDNISKHLDLDAANRELSMFKFPSFCATVTVSGRNFPQVLTASVLSRSIRPAFELT